MAVDDRPEDGEPQTPTAGVFSHENPNLRCADGTFDTDGVGMCQGI